MYERCSCKWCQLPYANIRESELVDLAQRIESSSGPFVDTVGVHTLAKAVLRFVDERDERSE
jgi:hypothetical protein